MGGVLEDGAEAVVIGGMVLDTNATPSMAANPGTTTPGKVRYALGGVARNIAECMSKLGAKPYMISALGFDLAGNMLSEHWRAAGLSLKGIKRSKDIETAIVCNIFDGKGELAAAVASVESIITYTSPNEDELIAMANALSSRDKLLPVQRGGNSVGTSVESLFQRLKPAI